MVQSKAGMPQPKSDTPESRVMYSKMQTFVSFQQEEENQSEISTTISHSWPPWTRLPNLHFATLKNIYYGITEES